jgi:hypothetical protein
MRDQSLILNETDKINNNSSTIGCALTNYNSMTKTNQKKNPNPKVKEEKCSPKKIVSEKSKENLKKVTLEKKVVYGTQTLKRKRDAAKSPDSAATNSTTHDTDSTSSKKNSQTTATILVSKSKTKTGLPLLLKNDK